MPIRKRLTSGGDRTLLDGTTLPLVYQKNLNRTKPTAYWGVREAGLGLRQAADYDYFLKEVSIRTLKKSLAGERLS